MWGFMAEQRNRLGFIFRPQGDEKDLGLTTRAALAMQGANGITAITPDTHPELKSLLDTVSGRADIPAPRAYVWHSVRPVANAVAISGKVPTVAFSEDILGLLSAEEVAAVAAHELGHVKNMGFSGKLNVLAGMGGGAAAWVATRPLKTAMHKQMAKDVMAGKMTSPAAQTMGFVKDMAIFTGAMAGAAVASRAEEYAADRYGAMLMGGDGVPLMSGLQKLGEFNEQHYRQTLLGKIMKPYQKLTSSHPEFDQRRQALGVSKEELAAYRGAHDAPQPQAAQQEQAAPAVEAPVAEAHAAESPNRGAWQQRVGEAAERGAPGQSR